MATVERVAMAMVGALKAEVTAPEAAAQEVEGNLDSAGAEEEALGKVRRLLVDSVAIDSYTGIVGHNRCTASTSEHRDSRIRQA